MNTLLLILSLIFGFVFLVLFLAARLRINNLELRRYELIIKLSKLEKERNSLKRELKEEREK